MRKKLLFRAWLLLALLLVGAGSAWGEVKSQYITYSSESTTTGWSTANSGRFTPIILEENGNYYLTVNQDQRDQNSTTVTGNILNGKAAAGDDFTLSFDMKLGNSTKDIPTFSIKDADNSANIFSLTPTASSSSTTTWNVNDDSETSVTLPNSNYYHSPIDQIDWCSYTIERIGTDTYVTITKKSDGSSILARTQVEASETGGLGNIVFGTGRYYANFAIDNIKLTSPNVAYINAVDQSGNALEMFSSTTTGTTGENTQVAFQRIVEKDGQFYDCGVMPKNQNGLFQKTVAYGSSTDITYTYNADIVYYRESNALLLKGSTYGEGNLDRASGGNWLDLAKNSYFYTKGGDIASGYYDINISARGYTNNQILHIYVLDSSGNMTEVGAVTWNSSDYAIKTISDVFVPQGGSVVIYNTDTANNRMRAAVDYLLVTNSTVTHTDEIPTVQFSSHSATTTITDLSFTEPTLTVTPSNYTAAYYSSDESIAKVNPLTGDVFLLDGTVANTPVTITAYVNYAVNGTTYAVSDSYRLTIKVPETEGEFSTVKNRSTAYVSGVYGTRKVEAVPYITMNTGNRNLSNNITLIRDIDNVKVVNTLASDGWRDVMFDVDGITPIEGTFYEFIPQVGGTLKVIGLNTNSNGVMLVAEDNIGTNLLTQQPSATALDSIEIDVHAKKYYLFGKNPYYCDDTNQMTTTTTTVGNTDNSSGWWQAFSDYYDIQPNNVLTIQFTNYSGTEVWNNWNLILSNQERNTSGYQEYLFLRTDNYGWNGWESKYAVLDANYNNVFNYINGAKVQLTIARNYDSVKNLNYIVVTALIKGTDGNLYKKQQYLLDPTPSVAIKAFLNVDNSHIEDVKAYQSSAWNVYQLNAFEFTPNYRFDYSSVIYRDGNFYSADAPATALSMDRFSLTDNGDGTVSLKQLIRGVEEGTNPAYTVDNYGDLDAVSTTDGTLTFDATKGGAYVVNATLNGVTTRYILTIPYDTHKWKFGPDNTEPTMTDVEEKYNKYGSEWRFNARYKGKDAATNYMDRYDHELICAKNTVSGDNILYVKNSEGLLFYSSSGSAFGYAAATKEGYSLEELKAKKLAEKIAELKATAEYQAMSAEEKQAAEDATVVTAQEINRILYNMYGDQDHTKMENPSSLWMGYLNSKFTIPYAKAGQYVKIHWQRYTTNNGSNYVVTNLNDLDDNPISGEMIISGYMSNSTWTDPKGNYIFKVAQDGPVTIQLVNNGWVTISDIELTDIYSTDLLLKGADNSELTIDDKTDYTDKPISLSSNGMTASKLEFSGYCGHVNSTNASSSQWKLEPDEGVNITGERKDYISYYGKYVVTADQNSGSGNVKLTEYIWDLSGTYVIDKIESWIAVGTVTPQAYPRTWDFTAQNMDYATTSKATMDATADTDNYGEWSVDSETDAYANKNITKDPDMYLHTYNAEGGDKPLFANGSELTAGGATFAETIGIGVTAWDETATDNITLSGEALTGVKGFNVPMLSAGDYVYVMASSEPTATVTAYTATTADGKTTYAEADGASVSTQDAKYLGNGVYGFKVGAGENVNMDITFDAETEVYKIGVSNIEKTFDKYGFSTESRDKNIDYSFISAPAYAITDNEFAYNYDQVVVTPSEQFGITPANTGVMLFNDALASDASPLFYAGNNLMDGTTNLPEADVTLAGQNMLVPIVEGGAISQHQTNSEDVDCDAFVLTYIYSTYSSTEGADVTTNADFGTDAFFRVKGSIEAPANKAYLLVPSENLPNALWDGGNGQGTAGAVKNLVRINFGEDDDTPTAIDSINIADAESLDNATWYNLSGQKLSGKPATKGVYIVNGKKVMVK